MDMQQLTDRLAITDVIALLSRAVDRADRETIVSCYAEDSFDDHGDWFKGSGREFANWVCDTSSPMKSMLHCLCQQLFDIQGDEAFVETAHVVDGVTQEGQLIHSSGRYIDHLRKIDGRWVIKYRQVVAEWSGPVEAKNFLGSGGIASTRDQSDPVYRKLRWPTEG